MTSNAVYWQQALTLKPRSRGFHLITQEVIEQLPALKDMDIGTLHLFIQHTSASLTLNENADPTVRADLERHINVLAPENAPYYQHTYEGDDDMPAHIKASLLGASVSIPVAQGKLLLGTWQGIYLGEHRDHGGPRRLIATAQGCATSFSDP
ncbi:secondary thiamine-phosphate synthase enzyme YjbQ [Aestuariibacter halophilus]|uniref:Secondary thiamine-phosphate synthase enzyme YjbQ n=1 Tax=Fluctibacter halophilus TaxID=226011 RepID=A0ABS8GB14_9ALTE|nr:secondary thiamine-phosphate synthase enzyme YjbQ [Aestuariibacter halophilus]MCC2617698.1 secondary thiamine-phosphate synthase enzyme YjbQ [Aestuariibacter halophilus]